MRSVLLLRAILFCIIAVSMVGLTACDPKDVFGPEEGPPVRDEVVLPRAFLGDAVPVPAGEREAYDSRGLVEVIGMYANALEARDYETCAAFLHDQFEFFPLQQDAEDFPWMEGDSWGRSVELDMMYNMFDPGYTGAPGPVEMFEFDPTIYRIRHLGGDRFEVQTIVVGIVMWGPADGAVIDTRLWFELVENFESFKIIRILEIPRRAGRDTAVESGSWGLIKSLYR